jgi:hypothetical protein
VKLGQQYWFPLNLKFRQKLEGFEVMDIANDSGIVRRRELSHKHSHGGWASMLKRIDSMVILGSHLGDLFKPAAAPSQIPRGMACLPVDQYFLATTVQRLLQFFGPPNTVGNLEMHGIRARRAEYLVETCLCSKKDVCSCARLFRIIKPSQVALQTSSPPSPLIATGCVIVGTYGGFRFSVRSRLKSQPFAFPERRQFPAIAEIKEDDEDKQDKPKEASKVKERLYSKQGSSDQTLELKYFQATSTQGSIYDGQEYDTPGNHHVSSPPAIGVTGSDNHQINHNTCHIHEAGYHRNLTNLWMDDTYHAYSSSSTPAYTQELRRLRRETRMASL